LLALLLTAAVGAACVHPGSATAKKRACPAVAKARSKGAKKKATRRCAKARKRAKRCTKKVRGRRVKVRCPRATARSPRSSRGAKRCTKKVHGRRVKVRCPRATAHTPRPLHGLGPRPVTTPSTAGGASPALPGAPSLSVTRLFAPTSIWNAPLPAGAPLDPSSPARTAAFVADVRRQIGVAIGPWINEREYSTPLYNVGSDQPRVPVMLDAAPLSLRRALSSVPIPAGAQQAAGTDGHMTIYQPSTDTLWEFWRARREADGWHASWGGAMTHISTSPGYYSNASWPGLRPSDGWNWGSTASSLPVIAGTVTIDEFRRGRIDHALALGVPVPCAQIFSWPAQRTDGHAWNADCMPEGAHLRLDPALDLSKLKLPPVTRMLAEAAQRYGMIVRDGTGGNATGFFGEDPRPVGFDPYNGPGGIYGGLRPWKFLPQFPWASVQLLRMNVCTSAPCPPPAGA
jgi:hypothetical protein